MPPPPYSLHHGQIPYPPKSSEYFFARPEHHLQYHQAKRPTVIPPPSSESESKCESCLAPANFMCSACKLVHYCSANCQVSQQKQLKLRNIDHFLSAEGALECTREILQEVLNIWCCCVGELNCVVWPQEEIKFHWNITSFPFSTYRKITNFYLSEKFNSFFKISLYISLSINHYLYFYLILFQQFLWLLQKRSLLSKCIAGGLGGTAIDH